jgi:adenylate cyclase class 2
MKEIEVKAKVRNPEEVERKLQNLGCKISDVMVDHDRVFTNSDKDFAEFQNDTNFIRIRTRNGKHTLTLKRPLSNELDCIEHQSEILEPEEVEKMLELMGYRKEVDFTKERRKTKYNKYNICLDTVPELGEYMEVETLLDEGDSEKHQLEMFEFVKTLGITDKDRTEHGYDTLVYLNRKGLK